MRSASLAGDELDVALHPPQVGSPGGAIVAAVLGAVIVQILLTGFTSVFTGEGATYGAPFPVGRSILCVLCGGSGLTFALPVFALNTTITAAGLWALMRLGGHVILAPLGGVLFLLVAAVMYFAMLAGVPFAGLPIPIATREASSVGLVALWVDCMIGAALFAVPHMLRRPARAAQTAASPR